MKLFVEVKARGTINVPDQAVEHVRNSGTDALEADMNEVILGELAAQIDNLDWSVQDWYERE